MFGVKIGTLVTISRQWGGACRLVGAKTTGMNVGWEIAKTRSLDLKPGEWAMLVDCYQEPTLPNPCYCFILLFDEQFWFYRINGTSQRHIVTKDEWDNPGWD